MSGQPGVIQLLTEIANGDGDIELKAVRAIAMAEGLISALNSSDAWIRAAVETYPRLPSQSTLRFNREVLASAGGAA